MKIFILILSLSLIGVASAQEADVNRPISVAPNSVYVEIGGSTAALASANYERLVLNRMAVRIGYGSFVFEQFRISTIATMIHAFVHTANEGIRIELGLGPLFVLRSSTSSFSVNRVITTPGIKLTGYVGTRYQEPDGGFTAKVGFAPLLGDKGVSAALGLAFGYSF